ncbi:MAG: M14 family metallopeptidase [Firmicutes bacterium]|nr:M14 family metallopeptidase [Bacillota bacterium]
MESGKVNPGNAQPSGIYFRIKEDKGYKSVSPDRQDVADKIDANKDKVLTENEIKNYMRKIDVLKDPSIASVDDKQVYKDYKLYLQNKPLPQAKAYHTYEELTTELKGLEAKYPDKAKLISLGKTGEGNDIWALKISKDVNSDTSSRPGVVYTGAHHAREWISMEEPLYIANHLLNDYATDPKAKNRVDNAEIWVVPLVNPDGYNYTRTDDSMWRKNRRPITDTGCPGNDEGNISEGQTCPINKTGKDTPIGVDLNRNYYDGNPDHFELYRPKGDKPCNTWDDFSATSDDPNDDTYRGPKGASEVEVQALQNLEFGRKNIKGIIDHHSYGKLILYPWGHTSQEVPDAKMYKDLGNGMAKAMSSPYKVMQSSGLYPTSGSSEDVAYANKKISYTIEMASSFQPPESQIDPLDKDVYAANMYFLDWIIDHKDKIG